MISRKKVLVFILFACATLISFRAVIFMREGFLIGHNWDWSFPGVGVLFEKLYLLPLYTWRDMNLGAEQTLTIAHIVPNFLLTFLYHLFGIGGAIVALLILVSLVSFILCKRFLDSEIRVTNANYIPAALYAFSPFLFSEVIGGSWYMWISYALAPLYFQSLMKFIETRSKGALLLFLFATFFVLASLNNYVLLEMIIVIYLAYGVFVKKKSFRKVFSGYAIAHVILVVVNLYWILPFLYSVTAFYSSVVVNPSFTGGFIGVENSTQDILNIFMLTGYLDRNMFFHALPGFMVPLFILAVLLVWALIAAPIALRKKGSAAGYKGLGWLVVLLLLMIIIKGGNPPFSGFTMWLFNTIPLLSLYRSPQHLMFAAAFIVPVLIAASMEFFSRTPRHRNSVYAVFSVCILIWTAGWWYTGDIGHEVLMGKKRDFIDIYTLAPGLQKYYESNDADEQRHRVLFMPASVSPRYQETRYQSRAQGGQPEYAYLKNPTFVSEFSPFANSVETLLCKGIDFDFISYLRLFSVKDIVLRRDITPHFTEAAKCWDDEKIKAILDSTPGLELVMDEEYTTWYRIKDEHHLPPIYPAQRTSFAATGVDDFVTLAKTSYLSNNPALVATFSLGGLEALTPEGAPTVHGLDSILLLDTDIVNLALEIVKNRVARGGSGAYFIYTKGKESIALNIKSEGTYEVWTKGGSGVGPGGSNQADGRVTHEAGWTKVAEKRFLAQEHMMATNGASEMLLVLPEVRVGYEDDLKRANLSHIYKSGLNNGGTATGEFRGGSAKRFYVSKDGEYSVKAYLSKWSAFESEGEVLTTGRILNTRNFVSIDAVSGWRFSEGSKEIRSQYETSKNSEGLHVSLLFEKGRSVNESVVAEKTFEGISIEERPYIYLSYRLDEPKVSEVQVEVSLTRAGGTLLPEKLMLEPRSNRSVIDIYERVRQIAGGIDLSRIEVEKVRIIFKKKLGADFSNRELHSHYSFTLRNFQFMTHNPIVVSFAEEATVLPPGRYFYYGRGGSTESASSLDTVPRGVESVYTVKRDGYVDLARRGRLSVVFDPARKLPEGVGADFPNEFLVTMAVDLEGDSGEDERIDLLLSPVVLSNKVFLSVPAYDEVRRRFPGKERYNLLSLGVRYKEDDSAGILHRSISETVLRYTRHQFNRSERGVGRGVLAIDGIERGVVLEPSGVASSGIRSGSVRLAEGWHEIGLGRVDGVEIDMLMIEPFGESVVVKEEERLPEVSFAKIDPTRYVVDVKGAVGPFALVFSENFHKGWKAFMRPALEGGGNGAEPKYALVGGWADRGMRTELTKHLLVNGYANAWMVPGPDSTGSAVETGASGDFQIVLEFAPQRLLETGLLISIVTVAGVVLYAIFGYLRRRRECSREE